MSRQHDSVYDYLGASKLYIDTDHVDVCGVRAKNCKNFSRERSHPPGSNTAAW